MSDAHQKAKAAVAMAFVAALVRRPLKHGLTGSQLSEIVLRSGISAAVFAEIEDQEWAERNPKGDDLAYASTFDLTRMLLKGNNTYPSEIPMKAVDRMINAFSALEAAHGVKTAKPLDRLCAEIGGQEHEAHLALAFLLALGHVTRSDAGFVRRLPMAPGVYGSSRADHPSRDELKRFISILDDVFAEQAKIPTEAPGTGTEMGFPNVPMGSDAAFDDRSIALEAGLVFENNFASPYRRGLSTPTAPRLSNANAKVTLEFLARRGLIVAAGPGSLYRISDRGKDLSLNNTGLEQALAVDSDTDREHNPTVAQVEPDPKSVFVIHGRNTRARDEMAIFLRACGLRPINFGELRSELGGTPTIDRIVEEGMRRAKGVIALFTGDEYSALRPELRAEDDQGDALSRWQARPNVIFEAGMAFGRARERVVFVVLGEAKLFTDVTGIHVLRPTNAPQGDRSILRDTLRKSMKCEVEDSNAWMIQGDFEVCTQNASKTTPPDPFSPSSSAMELSGFAPFYNMQEPLEMDRRNADTRKAIEGSTVMRLAANSCASYIDPALERHWPFVRERLEHGGILHLVFLDPFSSEKSARDTLNGTVGRDTKLRLDLLCRLYDKYPNVNIRVVGAQMYCTVFITQSEAFYDPYHLGKLHDRITNRFMCLRFSRAEKSDTKAQYAILLRHFESLWTVSSDFEQFFATNATAIQQTWPGAKITNPRH